LDERAALVLQLLENDLQNKIQSLQHATSILKAKDFAETRRQDVEAISQQFNGVVWSGFAGLDGKIVFSTQGILEGVDVNARPWFKAGLTKPSILDRHDALLLASKLPPRADPYKFIDMAVPVYSRENEPKGVLAIHIDWTWYQNQFSELLGAQHESSVISSVVTGKDGELRVATLGAGQSADDLKQMLLEINANSSSVAKSSNPPQGRYLISTLPAPEKSKLASLSWTVHLLQPAQVVANQSISAISLAMSALLVGMLAISLLMIYSAKRLSVRIAKHLDVIEHRSIEEMEKSEATLPREAAPLMQRTRELFTRARTKALMLKQQLAMAETSFTEINSLIHQAPVAIAMFDRDMKYLACSELWKKIYIAPGENPIGQSHYKMVPNIPDRWKEFHQQGLAGLALQRNNDCWTDGSGEMFWLNWSIEPWKDKGNQVGGIIIAA
jgi:PAS domain-containing protein